MGLIPEPEAKVELIDVVDSTLGFTLLAMSTTDA
jgi:hypothetical protein